MKKILSGISVFFISLYSKVIAAQMVALYGVPDVQPLYGVPTSPGSKISILILTIFQVLIIPIAFIIGIIVYLKKSKSSKEKKMIICLVMLLATILIVLGFSYITRYII